MSYTFGFSRLKTERLHTNCLWNEFISYVVNDYRYLGDHSVGVPPLPIPNREVKPNRADGTAFSCGRVGRRHFFLEFPWFLRTEGTFFVYMLVVVLARIGAAIGVLAPFSMLLG